MAFMKNIQKAAKFAQNLTAEDVNKGIEIGRRSLEKGVNGAISEVNGLLNKNRKYLIEQLRFYDRGAIDRHDEPHEKAIDAIRASINAQHRFQSFAGERPGNVVKCHERHLFNPQRLIILFSLGTSTATVNSSS